MKTFSTWFISVFFGLFIFLSGCRREAQSGKPPSPPSNADSGEISIAVSPDQTESGAGKQSRPPKPPEEKRVQEELKSGWTM